MFLLLLTLLLLLASLLMFLLPLLDFQLLFLFSAVAGVTSVVNAPSLVYYKGPHRFWHSCCYLHSLMINLLLLLILLLLMTLDHLLWLESLLWLPSLPLLRSLLLLVFPSFCDGPAGVPAKVESMKKLAPAASDKHYVSSHRALYGCFRKLF
jgi:hypothetical protein